MAREDFYLRHVGCGGVIKEDRSLRYELGLRYVAENSDDGNSDVRLAFGLRCECGKEIDGDPEVSLRCNSENRDDLQCKCDKCRPHSDNREIKIDDPKAEQEPIEVSRKRGIGYAIEKDASCKRSSGEHCWHPSVQVRKCCSCDARQTST